MKQLARFGKSPGIFLISILWICVCFISPAFSQEISAENPKSEVQKNAAPVKVDGITLFYIQGIASFSAEERAAAISQRIVTAASDRSFPPDSVNIVVTEGQLKIYAGKTFIMILTSDDARAEGADRMIIALWIQKNIRESIASYRQARSGPVLLRKSVYALGALILMILSLFISIFLIRHLNKILVKRIRSRIDHMEDKSFHIIRSSSLWKVIGILVRTLKIALIVAIIASFLQYILGLFPLTMGIAAYTLDLFLDPIASIGKNFVGFLPSLAFLIIIYLVTRYLLKLIKLLFKGIHEGGIKISTFEEEWAMPTYKILRMAVIAFALVVAYPHIPGSDTSAFKGISVFLGVLLSLGSSSFISNIIAGYSMQYRRAFKIGDLIEVGDQVGFVEEQRLLVTRLRSKKNEEISIPNSELLSSNIINYSKRAQDLGLILHSSVGIGYSTPWRMVDAMLKLAAERTEGLLKQPPPFVLKKSLDTFAVTYEINAFCDDATNMAFYYNQLHQNILDVFNENNIQIMTPAYEGDPEMPKIVPKDQWEKPLSNEG